MSAPCHDPSADTIVLIWHLCSAVGVLTAALVGKAVVFG